MADQIPGLQVLDRKLTIAGATYRLTCLRGPGMALLVPLLSGTFRRPDFTLDWLKTKYSIALGGIEGFSCVALTEAGQAAAALGVLPWPFRFGDRTEVAAQLVDGVTHSAHRRRGLFTLLGEMAREACDAAGLAFLFGFAHPQGSSFPGLVGSLGYRHLTHADLVEYRIPVRTVWMERLARRSGLFGHFYDRVLQRGLRPYLARDSVLDNSLLREGFAATCRHRPFHDYKMLLDNRVLAIDGARVWLKIRRGLIVGDIEAPADAEMDNTVRVLQRLALRFGIHQVLFQLSRGTRLAAFLQSRFAPRPGLNVVYRNLRSQIPAEMLRFTIGDLDNF